MRMRIVLGVLGVVYGACGSRPPAPAPAAFPRVPPPIAAAAPRALEEARAYELGDGRARDYRAAAKIYEQQCAGGAGDQTACRRLLQAIVEGRGVAQDPIVEARLATELCRRRGDAVGCFIAVLRIPEHELPPDLQASAQRAFATPCDVHHLDHCELGSNPLGFSRRRSVEERAHELDEHGCAIGVLDACMRLIEREDPEPSVAKTTVGRACDRGDAAACQAVGHPIDTAALCTAHDYTACGVLGCAGDEVAARIADANQVSVSCRDPSQSRTLTRPVANPVTPSQRQVFDSVEFHQLGMPHGTASVPRYQIYNLGTRPIADLQGYIIAYDAADHPIGSNGFEFRDVLEPGAATTLHAITNFGSSGDAVSFEVCVRLIGFSDEENRYHLARCPKDKPRGARWGDGRDTLELVVGLGGITGDHGLLGSEPNDAAVYEPFERTHPGILVSLDGSHLAVFLAIEPMTTAQAAQIMMTREPLLELPMVLEPVAIAYNLPGIDQLSLSPAVLAKIFQRQIVRWDDPSIARDNPGRRLPALPIAVVQDHGSSEALCVTTYLARAARGGWKLGVHRNVAFAGDFPQIDGTQPRAKAVAETPGALSYLGPGFTPGASLAVARIRNPGGQFVAPTPSTVTRGAYPLISPRSLFVQAQQPDQATLDAVRAYATWLLDDEQAIFPRLGLARPAPAVLEASRRRLAALRLAPPAPTPAE